MTDPARASIGSALTSQREAFDLASCGNAHWFTLFSADRTATSAMSAGIMVLPPADGSLEPHRHAQPEIYYVAEGAGLLSVDGVETELSAGMAAFIPGDALHSLRNVGVGELRIFYVFPVASFSEVVYRF